MCVRELWTRRRFYHYDLCFLLHFSALYFVLFIWFFCFCCIFYIYIFVLGWKFYLMFEVTHQYVIQHYISRQRHQKIIRQSIWTACCVCGCFFFLFWFSCVYPYCVATHVCASSVLFSYNIFSKHFFFYLIFGFSKNSDFFPLSPDFAIDKTIY